MKMTVRKILVLTLLLGFSSAHALVVGKVDIQRVLVAVNEGKRVKSQLKKEFDKKQKILRTEEARIKKMKAEFDKQAVVLNQQARAKKEKELQQEVYKIQQQSYKFQKEIQTKENELKNPILKKIQGIVEVISKQEKLDVTFESSTAPIVYAKQEKDITAQVIKAYDKKHK